MKVAIIGGSGKMGRWLASFLLKEGKEVIITGRNETKLQEASRQLGVEVATNEAAARNADVIVLSVPVDNFEPVVKEISPYTRPGQVIVDITSVKVFPVATMHRHIKSGLVLGIHPMFGPGATDVKNKNFVLTPVSDEEAALAQKVKGYLEARGARVSLLTPQEHDEMMAVVLGLSHFIALVAADTLAGLDHLKEMEVVAGSTYKVLLTLVGSVISQDLEFYASLQMNLPNMPKIEKVFQEKVKTWADLVKNGDSQGFACRMESVRKKLEKEIDLRKAYENMYRIVEG